MTFGHAAIGLAIARAYARGTPVQTNPTRAALFVCGALLPDIDFILFPGGGLSMFAHRGVTHSLFAACLVGVLALVVGRQQGVPSPTRLLVFVAAVVGSHSFADLSTTRGRGVALFWPFTNTRFEVIGLVRAAPFPPELWLAEFWGEGVWEIAFSVPLLAYALLPPRPSPS